MNNKIKIIYLFILLFFSVMLIYPIKIFGFVSGVLFCLSLVSFSFTILLIFIAFIYYSIFSIKLLYIIISECFSYYKVLGFHFDKVFFFIKKKFKFNKILFCSWIFYILITFFSFLWIFIYVWTICYFQINTDFTSLKLYYFYNNIEFFIFKEIIYIYIYIYNFLKLILFKLKLFYLWHGIPQNFVYSYININFFSVSFTFLEFIFAKLCKFYIYLFFIILLVFIISQFIFLKFGYDFIDVKVQVEQKLNIKLNFSLLRSFMYFISILGQKFLIFLGYICDILLLKIKNFFLSVKNNNIYIYDYIVSEKFVKNKISIKNEQITLRRNFEQNEIFFFVYKLPYFWGTFVHYFYELQRCIIYLFIRYYKFYLYFMIFLDLFMILSKYKFCVDFYLLNLYKNFKLKLIQTTFNIDNFLMFYDLLFIKINRFSIDVSKKKKKLFFESPYKAVIEILSFVSLDFDQMVKILEKALFEKKEKDNLIIIISSILYARYLYGNNFFNTFFFSDDEAFLDILDYYLFFIQNIKSRLNFELFFSKVVNLKSKELSSFGKGDLLVLNINYKVYKFIFNKIDIFFSFFFKIYNQYYNNYINLYLVQLYSNIYPILKRIRFIYIKYFDQSMLLLFYKSVQKFFFKICFISKFVLKKKKVVFNEKQKLYKFFTNKLESFFFSSFYKFTYKNLEKKKFLYSYFCENSFTVRKNLSDIQNIVSFKSNNNIKELITNLKIVKSNPVILFLYKDLYYSKSSYKFIYNNKFIDYYGILLFKKNYSFDFFKRKILNLFLSSMSTNRKQFENFEDDIIYKLYNSKLYDFVFTIDYSIVNWTENFYSSMKFFNILNYYYNFDLVTVPLNFTFFGFRFSDTFSNFFENFFGIRLNRFDFISLYEWDDFNYHNDSFFLAYMGENFFFFSIINDFNLEEDEVFYSSPDLDIEYEIFALQQGISVNQEFFSTNVFDNSNNSSSLKARIKMLNLKYGMNNVSSNLSLNNALFYQDYKERFFYDSYKYLVYLRNFVDSLFETGYYTGDYDFFSEFKTSLGYYGLTEKYYKKARELVLHQLTKAYLNKIKFGDFYKFNYLNKAGNISDFDNLVFEYDMYLMPRKFKNYITQFNSKHFFELQNIEKDTDTLFVSDQIYDNFNTLNVSEFWNGLNTGIDYFEASTSNYNDEFDEANIENYLVDNFDVLDDYEYNMELFLNFNDRYINTDLIEYNNFMFFEIVGLNDYYNFLFLQEVNLSYLNFYTISFFYDIIVLYSLNKINSNQLYILNSFDYLNPNSYILTNLQFESQTFWDVYFYFLYEYETISSTNIYMLRKYKLLKRYAHRTNRFFSRSNFFSSNSMSELLDDRESFLKDRKSLLLTYNTEAELDEESHDNFDFPKLLNSSLRLKKKASLAVSEIKRINSLITKLNDVYSSIYQMDVEFFQNLSEDSKEFHQLKHKYLTISEKQQEFFDRATDETLYYDPDYEDFVNVFSDYDYKLSPGLSNSHFALKKTKYFYFLLSAVLPNVNIIDKVYSLDKERDFIYMSSFKFLLNSIIRQYKYYLYLDDIGVGYLEDTSNDEYFLMLHNSRGKDSFNSEEDDLLPYFTDIYSKIFFNGLSPNKPGLVNKYLLKDADLLDISVDDINLADSSSSKIFSYFDDLEKLHVYNSKDFVNNINDPMSHEHLENNVTLFDRDRFEGYFVFEDFSYLFDVDFFVSYNDLYKDYILLEQDINKYLKIESHTITDLSKGVTSALYIYLDTYVSNVYSYYSKYYNYEQYIYPDLDDKEFDFDNGIGFDLYHLHYAETDLDEAEFHDDVDIDNDEEEQVGDEQDFTYTEKLELINDQAIDNPRIQNFVAPLSVYESLEEDYFSLVQGNIINFLFYSGLCKNNYNNYSYLNNFTYSTFIDYYVFVLKLQTLEFVLFYEYKQFLPIEYYQGPIKHYFLGITHNNITFIDYIYLNIKTFSNYIYTDSNFEMKIFKIFGSKIYYGFFIQCIFIIVFSIFNSIFLFIRLFYQMFLTLFIENDNSLMDFVEFEGTRDYIPDRFLDYQQADSTKTFYGDTSMPGYIFNKGIFWEEFDGMVDQFLDITNTLFDLEFFYEFFMKEWLEGSLIFPSTFFNDDNEGDLADYDGYFDREYNLNCEVYETFGINGVLQNIENRYFVNEIYASFFFSTYTSSLISLYVYGQYIIDICFLLFARLVYFIYFYFYLSFFKLIIYCCKICFFFIEVFLFIFFSFIQLCILYFKYINIYIYTYIYIFLSNLHISYYVHVYINRIYYCLYIVNLIIALVCDFFFVKINVVLDFLYVSFLNSFSQKLVNFIVDKVYIYIKKVIWYISLIILKSIILYFIFVYLFNNYDNIILGIEELYPASIYFSYRTIFFFYSIILFLAFLVIVFPTNGFKIYWSYRFFFLLLLLILRILAGLSNSLTFLFSYFWQFQNVSELNFKFNIYDIETMFNYDIFYNKFRLLLYNSQYYLGPRTYPILHAVVSWTDNIWTTFFGPFVYHFLKDIVFEIPWYNWQLQESFLVSELFVNGMVFSSTKIKNLMIKYNFLYDAFGALLDNPPIDLESDEILWGYMFDTFNNDLNFEEALKYQEMRFDLDSEPFNISELDCYSDAGQIVDLDEFSSYKHIKVYGLEEAEYLDKEPNFAPRVMLLRTQYYDLLREFGNHYSQLLLLEADMKDKIQVDPEDTEALKAFKEQSLEMRKHLDVLQSSLSTSSYSLERSSISLLDQLSTKIDPVSVIFEQESDSDENLFFLNQVEFIEDKLLLYDEETFITKLFSTDDNDFIEDINSLLLIQIDKLDAAFYTFSDIEKIYDVDNIKDETFISFFELSTLKSILSSSASFGIFYNISMHYFLQNVFLTPIWVYETLYLFFDTYLMKAGFFIAYYIDFSRLKMFNVVKDIYNSNNYMYNDVINFYSNFVNSFIIDLNEQLKDILVYYNLIYLFDFDFEVFALYREYNIEAFIRYMKKISNYPFFLKDEFLESKYSSVDNLYKYRNIVSPSFVSKSYIYANILENIRRDMWGDFSKVLDHNYFFSFYQPGWHNYNDMLPVFKTWDSDWSFQRHYNERGSINNINTHFKYYVDPVLRFLWYQTVEEYERFIGSRYSMLRFSETPFLQVDENLWESFYGFKAHVGVQSTEWLYNHALFMDFVRLKYRNNYPEFYRGAINKELFMTSEYVVQNLYMHNNRIKSVTWNHKFDTFVEGRVSLTTFKSKKGRFKNINNPPKINHNLFYTKFLVPDIGFIGSSNWAVHWDFLEYDSSLKKDSFYFNTSDTNETYHRVYHK